MNQQINLTALILAAGSSSRMGRFKPLLNYKGTTFIESIITNVSTVCQNIAIVTGCNSAELTSFIKEKYDLQKMNLSVVYNQEFEKGMFSSLKRGVEEIKNSRFVLYHLVDQPNLPQSFYKKFTLNIKHEYDWIQPRFNNFKGHPIIFGERVINRILKSPETSNLRDVSNYPEFSKYFWDCKYKEIHTDLDTPDDLKKLKQE